MFGIKKKFKDSLKRNEVRYFNKLYAKANSEILIAQTCKKGEGLRNKRALKNLNNKYPFISELTKVLCGVNNVELKRKIIVAEIIQFLTLIYQTNKYTVKDGDCVYELKDYIKVRENLSNDLPQILTEIATFHFVNSTDEQKLGIIEYTTNDSLSKLTISLSNSTLFDNHRNSFNLKEYEDITNLQSFQYLMCFYILEVLGKGINEVNKAEIYTYFNKSFSISRRNKPQLMTTKNWDNFKLNKLDTIAECQFYIDLCKDLKKLTGLPTKPSLPS